MLLNHCLKIRRPRFCCATRSKMRYISELEHKVQTLHTEATIFSAKLTLLQVKPERRMARSFTMKIRTIHYQIDA
ncbi:hypothetical protein MTR_7g024430 [Medicago truncatula]|uniref:Uncharacterized protein n=1 Tax=Medicago truncatula TaxID=3880 RepID=G7KWV1_MEDTR|nr:hypothetical protein MTR_7g024430 [Medicago truncatula]